MCVRTDGTVLGVKALCSMAGGAASGGGGHKVPGDPAAPPQDLLHIQDLHSGQAWWTTSPDASLTTCRPHAAVFFIIKISTC